MVRLPTANRGPDLVDDQAEQEEVEDEAADGEDGGNEPVPVAHRAVRGEPCLRAGIEKDAPREPYGLSKAGVCAAAIALRHCHPEQGEPEDAAPRADE